MGNPCEQRDTIKDIWESIDPLKSATARMEAAIARMVEEFTSLSRDLRDNMLNERELKTRIEQNTSDINRTFQLIREEQAIRAKELKDIMSERERIKKDDIDPLWTFKDQFEGSVSTLKSITVICAVISAGATLVSLLR